MLNHKGTRQIETERLILRRFRPDDAGEMFKNWCDDAEVTKYMTWLPHGSVEVTRGILGEWVTSYDKAECYHWAIVWRESGEVTGSIGVNTISEQWSWCETGYCIAKALWGRGVMTEALRAVIGYLFTEVGFNRIQAKHHVDNVGSGRVMQKSGMKLEGVLRQYAYKADLGFHDLPIYSILRSEYMGEQA